MLVAEVNDAISNILDGLLFDLVRCRTLFLTLAPLPLSWRASMIVSKDV